MVRALLDGRKTQTRRVIKPQPSMVDEVGAWDGNGWPYSLISCPYGQPGDLLWVRESFCPDWTNEIIHKADDSTGTGARKAGYAKEPKYKPSIHMPRKYSRITLRIKDIRVERVQDISGADSFLEGAGSPVGTPLRYGSVTEDWNRRAFSSLWDSINYKRGYGWGSNPWVWVVEFEVIKENIDLVLSSENA